MAEDDDARMASAGAAASSLANSSILTSTRSGPLSITSSASCTASSSDAAAVDALGRRRRVLGQAMPGDILQRLRDQLRRAGERRRIRVPDAHIPAGAREHIGPGAPDQPHAHQPHRRHALSSTRLVARSA